MTKTIFALLSVLIISCSKNYQPRTLNNVSIQQINIDSTSIRAIHAVSKSELYYAGSNGVIGHTTDGGKHWNETTIIYRDSIIPHFRSIASNGKNLFILGIGTPALLYKLNDDNTPELVYTENDEKAFYDSMQFFDDKHGIAMGDPTANCISIITTKDGGSTWNKVPCDNLQPFIEEEAAFAASNTNIAIHNNTVWIATGGLSARVFKSENFGETWTIYNTPIIQGESTTGIYSIDFYDDNKGIIIGGDYTKPELNKGNKAVTADGGKTWNLISEGESPNYKSCVQYVPDTNGKEIVAVGKTGVSFSNDAGITWVDISSEGYYAIKFVDKHTAWLSGHNKIGKMILK